MPFDWMEPKRNPDHTRTLAAKREAMYRAELVDRAALLHRLGHARASARARLLANVGWDFEQAPNPIAPEPGGEGAAPGGHAGTAALVEAAIDLILDREYGAANGAPRTPRTKGGPK